MATTEVGIDFLQGQVDNCDSIVENIDKIVPKLYKIRQQALAQKEYINDVNKTILTHIDTTVSLTTAKSITLSNPVSFSTDTTISNDVTIVGVNSRQIIQSLFKFKHDIGTTKHFTTEQKGSEDERIKGFNLSDVVEITTSLDNLLKKDSTTGTAINDGASDVTTLFKKLNVTSVSVTPSEVSATTLIASGRTVNAYEYDGTNNGGVKSGFTTPIGAMTDIILGFGLT